jgi:hypothetical protein
MGSNITYQLNTLIAEGYLVAEQVTNQMSDVYFFEQWVNLLWKRRSNDMIKTIDAASIDIEINYQDARAKILPIFKDKDIAEVRRQFFAITEEQVEQFMIKEFGYAIKPIKTAKQIRHEKNR